MAAPGTPAASGPTRRLMIREMVLENFKSYAGPQFVGPFHKARPAGARGAPRRSKNGGRVPT